MLINLKINAVDIFLEKRKTRLLVGRLKKENEQFIFTYNEAYLRAKNIIELGPEFPLTQREFKSDKLFPSLQDRIPSEQNPAYSEYCRLMNVNPNERDPLVLLATIGSKGPSSFVFVPVFERSFKPEHVIDFRKALGFTTREFAQIFEISQPSLVSIERKKISGKDVLKRLEIIISFPEVAISLLTINSGFLQHAKYDHALSFLKGLVNNSKCIL